MPGRKYKADWLRLRQQRPRIVVGATRFSFEHGALLDRQRLMEDIAFDLARGLQHDAPAMHRADDMAANDDLLGGNASGDGCAFTNHDVAALNVPVDNSVDLASPLPAGIT